MKKIVIVLSIIIFAYLSYCLIFGVTKIRTETKRLDATREFKGTYKGKLQLIGDNKKFRTDSNFESDKIYLDLNYNTGEAFILFALEKYKLDSVYLNKSNIMISGLVNINYFSLEPEDKLKSIFNISEIYFEGDYSQIKKIESFTDMDGGRYDMFKKTYRQENIKSIENIYSGKGYFISNNTKVEFKFEFKKNGGAYY